MSAKSGPDPLPGLCISPDWPPVPLAVSIPVRYIRGHETRLERPARRTPAVCQRQLRWHLPGSLGSTRRRQSRTLRRPTATMRSPSGPATPCASCSRPTAKCFSSPAARRPTPWPSPRSASRITRSSATSWPTSKPTSVAPPEFFSNGTKLLVVGGESGKGPARGRRGARRQTLRLALSPAAGREYLASHGARHGLPAGRDCNRSAKRVGGSGSSCTWTVHASPTRSPRSASRPRRSPGRRASTCSRFGGDEERPGARRRRRVLQAGARRGF